MSEFLKKHMEYIKSIDMSEIIQIKAKGIFLKFTIHYIEKPEGGFATTVKDFNLDNHGETFEEARNYTLVALLQMVNY